MKNLFVALLVLICLKASSQCASQTVIQNPTFQGGGNNYSPPSPWLGCSATEWNNYTSSSGSVVVSSGIYNGAGVSQLLNLPLATGVLYTATIVTGAGGGICECQVWGGWSSCDASSSAQELWNSGNGAAAAATNTFTFHASQNFTYISIVYYYDPHWGGSGGSFVLNSFTLSSAATPLVVTTQLDNNSCNASSTGRATAHATGYSPFTYNWSNSQTDSILQNVAAGNYDVTVTDAQGCIVNDSVTVGQLPPLTATILPLGDTLTSQLAVTYQWYLNGHSIAGAINRDYIPLQNGNYYVIITDTNGCTSSASNIIYVGNITTGISELNSVGISLYPNPATNTVTVNSDGNSSYTFTIYDLTGRKILTKEMAGVGTINVSQLAKGIYVARIEDSDKLYSQKLIIQ